MRGALRPVASALVLMALAAGCRGEFFTGPEVDATTIEPGAPIYRASGAFVPLAYPTTGRATYLIDGEGNAALALDEAFSTPPIPERAVFLSNTPHMDGAVRVGSLDAESGPVRWTFRMPPGAVWRYVLVWSEELGVAVGRAELIAAM